MTYKICRAFCIIWAMFGCLFLGRLLEDFIYKSDAVFTFDSITSVLYIAAMLICGFLVPLFVNLNWKLPRG